MHMWLAKVRITISGMISLSGIHFFKKLSFWGARINFILRPCSSNQLLNFDNVVKFVCKPSATYTAIPPQMKAKVINLAEVNGSL